MRPRRVGKVFFTFRSRLHRTPRRFRDPRLFFRHRFLRNSHLLRHGLRRFVDGLADRRYRRYVRFLCIGSRSHKGESWRSFCRFGRYRRCFRQIVCLFFPSRFRRQPQFGRRWDTDVLHPFGQTVGITGRILDLPGRRRILRRHVGLTVFFHLAADARRRMAKAGPPGCAQSRPGLSLPGPFELEKDQCQDDDCQQRCQR